MSGLFPFGAAVGSVGSDCLHPIPGATFPCRSVSQGLHPRPIQTWCRSRPTALTGESLKKQSNRTGSRTARPRPRNRSFRILAPLTDTPQIPLLYWQFCACSTSKAMDWIGGIGLRPCTARCFAPIRATLAPVRIRAKMSANPLRDLGHLEDDLVQCLVAEAARAWPDKYFPVTSLYCGRSSCGDKLTQDTHGDQRGLTL